MIQTQFKREFLFFSRGVSLKRRLRLVSSKIMYILVPDLGTKISQFSTMRALFLLDDSSSAPLKSPKFAWHHHQSLDTYTIFLTASSEAIALLAVLQVAVLLLLAILSIYNNFIML